MAFRVIGDILLRRAERTAEEREVIAELLRDYGCQDERELADGLLSVLVLSRARFRSLELLEV